MASIGEIATLLNKQTELLEANFKKELKSTKTSILQSVNAMISEYANKIVNLEQTVHKLNEDVQFLKRELNDKTLQLQFDNRKKNVMLFRVDKKENSNWKLQNKNDIDCIYRIGKKGFSSRSIKVELQRSSKRNF
ncbi:EFCAB14 family protein [Megaselia abdita]